MPSEQMKSEILRSIVENIKENLLGYFVEEKSATEPEEAFRTLFLEKPRNGWLPERYMGRPLEQALYHKFQVVADALRYALAEQKKIDELRIDLGIRVSCDDLTWVDYIYSTERPNWVPGLLIYTSDAHAWQYWFDNLDEFTAHLWDQYLKLEQGYALATAFLEKVALLEKKVFLATFDLRVGEHQFSFCRTIETNTIEEAKARAVEHAKNFYLGEPEPDEDWFVFTGEVAVRCREVQETNPARLVTRLAL